MEAVFDQVKKAKKNDVDGLAGWMKSAKLTDKVNEGQLKQLFNGVPNPKDVPLQKFTEIITKFAQDNKLNFDEIVKKLISAAPAFLKSSVGGIASKALGKLGF